MLNGMENANITYRTVYGSIDVDIMVEIEQCYEFLFDDADVYFFKQRFKEQPHIITVLALHKDRIVGFKIGYSYNDNTFYSWIGGVLPNYRRIGIAKSLATHQSEAAKNQGFTKLRTKSMNRFKPMMIFNLQQGFDIVKCYTNDSGQTKIVFEKSID